MCLQLCGRHPREQEGKGGVPRALEIRGEPRPRHCRLTLPFWMLDVRPPHPQPPESPASLSWTPSGCSISSPSGSKPFLSSVSVLQSSPSCLSICPPLSSHLILPSFPRSGWLPPPPPSPPLFLGRPPGRTSLSLSSHPFLPPALTSPSFDLFPSRCSSASCLLPWVSSLPVSVFLVSTLPVRLSPGFCSLRPFVYVRLSLHLRHPPSLSLEVSPLSLAHLLEGVPSRHPFFPGVGGELPSGSGRGGNPHSLPPLGGAPGPAEEPLGGPSCFLSSSRPHTPPPSQFPLGLSHPPSLLRPRCAPGAPGPARAARRGRSADGPRSYFAESGRGCSPPDGAGLGAHPGPRRPPGRGLPGSPLPPASRPRAPRASSTHKCQRTAAAPMLTAGRAGTSRAGPGVRGVRGAGTPTDRPLAERSQLQAPRPALRLPASEPARLTR